MGKRFIEVRELGSGSRVFLNLDNVQGFTERTTFGGTFVDVVFNYGDAGANFRINETYSSIKARVENLDR